MTHFFSTILVSMKIVGLLVGGYLVGLTYATYKIKQDPFLKYLSFGFGTILVGMLLEEAFHWLFPMTSSIVHLIEAIVLLLGCLMIVYAVYIN